MKKLSNAGISLLYLYLCGIVIVAFCSAITMFGQQGKDRNDRAGKYMSFDRR